MRIRPLTPASLREMALVARRMRRTLIEVEGEEIGGSMYSMEWLLERVRWHLDPRSCTGEVFLAIADDAVVAGHTIVRIERPAQGEPFGLFSTTWVEPAYRRQALAAALLRRGEQWMAEQGVATASTWTSSTNAPLIALYARHGYTEAERGEHPGTGTAMVRLARQWA
jgi:GNAT superfamily N-acetyltransferase